jgi:UDP-N-acetylglucosamine--N-acetylmuramyl-(pentapeptide) pyrophosphoryl-undecaprenol N-acetylglucosamine transferase
MKIILTGGGTAGHVMPCIRVGQALKRINETLDLCYVGNDRYIEKKLAEEHHIPFISVDSMGMEGSRFNKMKALALQIKGVFSVYRLFKKNKPDAVFSSGGFVSMPVLVVATWLGIPFYLHEQNAVVGKAVRLFAKNAKKIFTSFEETEGISSQAKVICTGNPVNIRRQQTKLKKSHILFTGGSGGSTYLNQLGVALASRNPALQVVIVAGEKQKLELQEQTKEMTNLTVYGFIDHLAQLIDQSSLVVSRAGSGTIFELMQHHLPIILVPLSTSSHNHQWKNAFYFDQKEMVVMIEEGEIKEITKDIEKIINDREKKERLIENQKKIRFVDSAHCIAFEMMKSLERV